MLIKFLTFDSQVATLWEWDSLLSLIFYVTVTSKPFILISNFFYNAKYIYIYIYINYFFLRMYAKYIWLFCCHVKIFYSFFVGVLFYSLIHFSSNQLFIEEGPTHQATSQLFSLLFYLWSERGEQACRLTIPIVYQSHSQRTSCCLQCYASNNNFSHCHRHRVLINSYHRTVLRGFSNFFSLYFFFFFFYFSIWTQTFFFFWNLPSKKGRENR